MEASSHPINPAVPGGSPAGAPSRKPRRFRRYGALATVVAVGAIAALRLGAAEELGLPKALGGGPTADGVFEDLRDAGIPITDGRPASAEFASLARQNRCDDSRTFVRTDARVGWGIICIGLDPAAASRLVDGMDGAPMLVGPLYADAEGRDVIVFGLGWPGDASRTIHRALGDSSGTYLTPLR